MDVCPSRLASFIDRGEWIDGDSGSLAGDVMDGDSVRASQLFLEYDRNKSNS